jgi:hypothetical protein
MKFPSGDSSEGVAGARRFSSNMQFARKEECPMRLLRSVSASSGVIAGRSVSHRRPILRWAGICVTVVTTAAAVLFASFVAVAIGLT